MAFNVKQLYMKMKIKKLLAIGVLLIAFIAVSACSKDEEITKEQLKGTWVWERTTVNGRDVCYGSDESAICHCSRVPFFVFHEKDVESFTYRDNSCELERSVGIYAFSENMVFIEGNAARITMEKRGRFSRKRLVVEERSRMGVTTVSYFVKE